MLDKTQGILVSSDTQGSHGTLNISGPALSGCTKAAINSALAYLPFVLNPTWVQGQLVYDLSCREGDQLDPLHASLLGCSEGTIATRSLISEMHSAMRQSVVNTLQELGYKEAFASNDHHRVIAFAA